jgi:transcription initiation factor IIE alpha subunit
MPKESELPKDRHVVCPECDADVNLAESDKCPNCRLDVAWIFEKRRRDKALERLKQREEDEQKKSDKDAGKGKGFFENF